MIFTGSYRSLRSKFYQLNNIVPLVALLEFFGFVLVVCGRDVIHFKVLEADSSVGVNGTRDKCVATDNCVFAHDGVATENGCSGVYGYVI